MDGLAVRFVQLRNGYNPLEGLHTASVCLAGVKYIRQDEWNLFRNRLLQLAHKD